MRMGQGKKGSGRNLIYKGGRGREMLGGEGVIENKERTE